MTTAVIVWDVVIGLRFAHARSQALLFLIFGMSGRTPSGFGFGGGPGPGPGPGGGPDFPGSGSGNPGFTWDQIIEIFSPTFRDAGGERSSSSSRKPNNRG
jgi:hypothetical protein